MSQIYEKKCCLHIELIPLIAHIFVLAKEVGYPGFGSLEVSKLGLGLDKAWRIYSMKGRNVSFLSNKMLVTSLH